MNGIGVTESRAERKRLSVEAVYDIESERDWGGFLVGGIRHADGEYIEKNIWNTKGFDPREKEFAEEIGSTDGNVWAHAGGSYDHKWFLQCGRNDGTSWDIQVAGSRIVSARRGSLRLLDSNALVKISLRDFTKGLGVEKSNHGLLCETPDECGNECGGFCRFHRGMSRQDFGRVREYLRDDCESLFGALQRLQGFGEQHDLDLAFTVGSSSYACAKRWLQLPDAELSLDDHLFARKGYFGGRVQIFRPQAESGNRYDINASYPYALAMLELPWGCSFKRFGKYAASEFESGREGFIAARVLVPEMWIPPLPVRLRDRIAYPTGEIEGVWTCSELRNAVSLGCVIRNISEGLFWPETRRVFQPWIMKLWELRKNDRHGKSGPLGTFLKFYMNSLTGKLGTRPVSKRYVLNPKSPQLNWEQLGSGIWSFDGPTVRRQKSTGNWVAGEPCCHVEWAAYITAFGRIRWLEQARAGELLGADMVMGDTDSVYCTGIREKELGDELGQWQYEGGFESGWQWNDYLKREEWQIGFDAIAPKFYRFLPSTKDGHAVAVVKSKGVGKREAGGFSELFSRGTQTFRARGMAGFRWASRKGNLFQRNDTERTISKGYGDRIFDARSGVTNPPRMVDLK